MNFSSEVRNRLMVEEMVDILEEDIPISKDREPNTENEDLVDHFKKIAQDVYYQSTVTSPLLFHYLHKNSLKIEAYIRGIISLIEYGDRYRRYSPDGMSFTYFLHLKMTNLEKMIEDAMNHSIDFRYRSIGIEIYSAAFLMAALKKLQFVRSIHNHVNSIGVIQSIKPQSTCPICYTDKYTPNNYMVQTSCNHFYHRECIKKWLKINKSCPTCRRKLIFSSEDENNEGEMIVSEDFVSFLVNHANLISSVS